MGLVIAILFFLALCGVCAMFLVKKHKSRSGQVIRPVQNTQTVAGMFALFVMRVFGHPLRNIQGLREKVVFERWNFNREVVLLI